MHPNYLKAEKKKIGAARGLGAFKPVREDRVRVPVEPVASYKEKAAHGSPTLCNMENRTEQRASACSQSENATRRPLTFPLRI